jgi:signal transduction histidine kinase
VERDLEQRIHRLERRLDRERKARLIAEQIAEVGTRNLYEANRDLDQRIMERTAELDAALASAKAATAAKSRFLAQMSHQAKTPLNGLLGMLELLGAELHDERSRQWHAAATRSAARLDRLVHSLIRYAELDGVDLRTGAPSRALGEVLASIEHRWGQRCLRAGQLLFVEGTIGPDIEISAPPQLDVAVDELLSNVIEHSDRGAVTVRSGEPVPAGAVARIEILDPGPGLDPSDVERARALGAVEGQTEVVDRPIGLGLALVDRIVSGLGGSWGTLEHPESGVFLNLPQVGRSSDSPRRVRS